MQQYKVGFLAEEIQTNQYHNIRPFQLFNNHDLFMYRLIDGYEKYI